MAGIEIKHENNSLRFVSLYCRPSARNQEKLMKTVINKLGLRLPNSVISIDSNERNKYGKAALQRKAITY
jgi:molecular chaperone DnaK (HSP70)